MDHKLLFLIGVVFAVGCETLGDEGCFDNSQACAPTDCEKETGGVGGAEEDAALAVCGDNIINGNEQCDGIDLAGESCESLNEGVGRLGCDPQVCTFDVSECTPDLPIDDPECKDVENAACVISGFDPTIHCGEHMATRFVESSCLIALDPKVCASSIALNEIMLLDVTTCFIWQKEYVTDKTWQQAKDFCETLEYAGRSDWHLPSLSALLTLVDSGFPDTPALVFWSANPTECVSVHDGLIRNDMWAAANAIRCVNTNVN